MQSISLTEMTLLASGDDGFCTKPLLPKRLDAQFIVIRQLSYDIFKHFVKQ